MSNNIIWQILDYSIKIWASDIHISEWKTIKFRVNWVIKSSDNWWIIDNGQSWLILNDLLNWNKDLLEKYRDFNDLDFSYIHSDLTSFRVNAFHRLWKRSFVLRRISSEAMDMKALMLPPATDLFTIMKQWLVLITWPTWSWKSTSMISILEKINKERSEHILTIEDPIEFVFTDKRSIFSQREVGRDTKNFESALKSALREDPNVIMIWELRDIDTVKAALELAETWHLVISTLHTWNAVQSVNRLLSFFPLESQSFVREKLSFTLKWVLSQKLVPKIWWWRIWLFELMLVDTWIRNLIRSGEIEMIQSVLETSGKIWMITMKKYAEKLREHWLVEEKDYKNFFIED